MKILTVVLLTLGISAVAHSKMPPSLAQILAGYPKEEVSIYIKEVGSDRPLAELNHTVLRTPASVVKLLTTYTALSELGADYRWKTVIYADKEINQGNLDGDIMVKGFGDPGLINEDVEEIVKQLKSKGIKSISGDLVVDDSYFAVSNRNSVMFDRSPYRPYNANPSAILINHRASAIRLVPDKEKKEIIVSKLIPDSSYHLIAAIKGHQGKCRKHEPNIRVKSDNLSQSTITLSGKYSLNCPPATIYRLLTHPAKMFYATFKYMLKQHGLSFSGKMKMAEIPHRARVIYTHLSRPLIEIIADINKNSNNVMARQTLLTIAAHKSGAPSTEKQGADTVLKILKANEILHENATIKNGSGLSRQAKLSALGMAKLIQLGYKKYGSLWLNTMAIMGTDGTLRHRMSATEVKGRAWMKTGSINKTKSIAGIVKAKSDKLFVVAILISGNSAGGKQGAGLQEKIINWVYER